MITTFEEITCPLSDDELALIPLLVENFKKYNETNPIKAPKIVAGMNQWLIKHGRKMKFTEARLRKCCNYIRSNGLIPLIATSSGYFVSYNKETIQSQIRSLQERASAIYACANGMKKFLINEQQAELTL